MYSFNIANAIRTFDSVNFFQTNILKPSNLFAKSIRRFFTPHNASRNNIRHFQQSSYPAPLFSKQSTSTQRSTKTSYSTRPFAARATQSKAGFSTFPHPVRETRFFSQQHESKTITFAFSGSPIYSTDFYSPPVVEVAFITFTIKNTWIPVGFTAGRSQNVFTSFFKPFAEASVPRENDREGTRAHQTHKNQSNFNQPYVRQTHRGQPEASYTRPQQAQQTRAEQTAGQRTSAVPPKASVNTSASQTNSQSALPTEISTYEQALGYMKLSGQDLTASSARKQYLKLQRQMHPDKNTGDADATKKVQLLNQAYEIVKTQNGYE